MSLFCKDSLTVYHIHIPRTGGRFVTQTLVKNNYAVYFSEEPFLYGIHPMHLHYPLYEYLDGVTEAIQFAVVRNPVSRFKSKISSLILKRNYDQNQIDKFDDYDYFYNFICYEDLTAHWHNNWFRPQKDFIGESTKIWKFENGLTKNFRDWYYDLTGDILEDKEYSYWGDEETELNPKRKEYKMSNKLIQNVEEYYKEDFEIFNYC